MKRLALITILVFGLVGRLGTARVLGRGPGTVDLGFELPRT